MDVPTMYTVRTMAPAAKDERIYIRISEEDALSWKAAAEAEDMTLSDWIRRTCRAALAGKPTKPKKR